MSQERKPYGRDQDKRPFTRDHERKPFGRDRDRDSDRKPFGRDQERNPFDRDERKFFNRNDQERSSSTKDQERRPFDRNQNRRPFDRDQDRKPFNRDQDRKPFNRDQDRKPFNRDQDRKPFDRDQERRPFNRDHDRKPFNRDQDRKPFDRDQERKPFNRAPSRDGDAARDLGSKFSKSDSFSPRNDYISIPYTTAASEFLYGLNVVYAALKSRRRSLYTLYLHKRARDNVYKGHDLERLASSASVKIKRVENDFLPVMDKMTDGRPHNGVILEVSPLPVPAVEQLGKVDHQKKQIPLLLSRTQTAEDRALHGTSQALSPPTAAWRQPFVLLLDGILDPGNLGNIIRTAYFYGVDAVAICVNTCAPLTSSALHKAASGATEGLPILAIQRPADFVSSSSRNGWRVHAAVAPEGGSFKHTTRSQFATNKMVSPLTRAPSILMMGAEGEGLRLNLKNKAGHYVVIAGQHRHAASDMGVDSLNVSAATAVLIEAFMRPPVETRETRERRLNAASTDETNDVEHAEESNDGDNVEEMNSTDAVAKKDDVEEKDDEKLF